MLLLYGGTDDGDDGQTKFGKRNDESGAPFVIDVAADDEAEVIVRLSDVANVDDRHKSACG